MREGKTEFGNFCIGEKEELFECALFLTKELKEELSTGIFSWALTGGSTPSAFYRYCIENEKLDGALIDGTVWTTSDERCVPLDSEESNFGNADRHMLQPVDVSLDDKFSWPTELSPVEAAEKYEANWFSRVGEGISYDMCFLGMGDDCHTASIFPGSSLIMDSPCQLFAAVEVPDKGWRLSITPKGLEHAKRIVVMTLGSSKTEALRDVFLGEYDPKNKPIQLLKNSAEKVWWLMDESAVDGIRFE
jgi:6-phosphogluconolactonase